MGKKFFVTTICLLILVFLMSSLPAMAQGKAEPDRYTATTADGVDLAIKHYRPDNSARFHKGAQPIVLMPGIITNINEFDIHTPEGQTYDVKLPSPLASWAKGDKYIKKDPMKYYSLAHYLWLQGYDVWLANYRGEGKEPYVSGGAVGYSIDDLGIYDAPAIVEKVHELTGKHPIWLSHSMGSTMAYIYLQGAKYGDGDNPHVVSDPALAQERNGGNGPQSVKAFIDLDGPMCPFSGVLLDNTLVWVALYWPWYIGFGGIAEIAGELFKEPVLILGDISWNIWEMLGMPDLGPLNAVFSMNWKNVDTEVSRFAARYALDGVSTRVLAQFSDSSAHGKFREDFFHGNWDLYPPDPQEGDGYYYYSDHLDMIKIPALVLADDRNDLTNPEDIKSFYLKKTRTSLDEFMRVPDAAHADLVFGLNAPTVTFPKIGTWLRKLSR